MILQMILRIYGDLIHCRYVSLLFAVTPRVLDFRKTESMNVYWNSNAQAELQWWHQNVVTVNGSAINPPPTDLYIT